MDYYQESLKAVNRLVRKEMYYEAQNFALYKNIDESEVNTSFILYNHLISEHKNVTWIDTVDFDASDFDIVIIPAQKFSSTGNYISRINVKNANKIVVFSFETNKVDHVTSENTAMVITNQKGYNV